MLDNLNLKQLLFIDIETVPQYSDFASVPEGMSSFWEKKSSFFRNEDQLPEDVYQRAGIYAEFGKIVCVSVGIITGEKNNYGFKLKSYCNDDEHVLLTNFSLMLSELESKREIIFCAHNGKEFDYPYLSRRYLINGLKLPDALNNSGKKPWEIKHLDTLELWKFGDYKHYTSLDLLTNIFNIPSPKEEIDGSMVADVYYKEKDLDKIIRYCENDVLAVAQLVMRYVNLPLINESNIIRT
jgi:3'-5' exonuclease